MTVVWTLVFLAIGVVIGLAGTLIFTQSNRIVSALSGIVGSLGLSFLAKAIGIAGGFVAPSLWGFVAAVIGAILLTVIYGVVAKRIA